MAMRLKASACPPLPDGSPVGEDVRHGCEKPVVNRDMLVEDVMTRDVVTCDLEASVAAAARLMVEGDIGSVIVTRHGDPFGIVTETDLVRAGVLTDRPFSAVTVEDIVSHPLVTIGPQSTIRTAVARMRSNDVKKLAVVENLDLVGILTRTDVVLHYQDIVNEVYRRSRRDEDETGE